MCLDDLIFSQCFGQFEPKDLQGSCRHANEVANFGHVSQICARHGANDVQPGLIQEVLAGVQKLCKAVHFGPLLSVVMSNVFRICTRRHDCGAINWGKMG